MSLIVGRLGITKWGTGSLAITGAAAFTPLPNIQADEIEFVLTSTDPKLDVISNNIPPPDPASQYISIDPSSGLGIALAANASELGVRRNDLAATSTVVRYIWRRYRAS